MRKYFSNFKKERAQFIEKETMISQMSRNVSETYITSYDAEFKSVAYMQGIDH